MFAKLLEVFKFLRAKLLVNNDAWMALLGRVIWPQLTESITANYLRKVLICSVPCSSVHRLSTEISLSCRLWT